MLDASFQPTRRELVRSLAALGALLPLAGCTGDRPEASSQGSDGSLHPGEPASPGTLSLGIPASGSLDPARAVTLADQQVVYQLFDSLMRYDYAAGALVCRACLSLEASDDARTFTFTLRTAAFHDGEPVRSTDFKRAWERLVRPQAGASGADGARSMAYLLSLVEGFEAFRSGGAEELAGILCPDERTLTVRLARPYADFPFIAAHPCLAPVPACAEEDAAAFARGPVGNGAFKLAGDGARADGALALMRFEGHPLDTVALEQVSIAVCEDARDAYGRFKEGLLDVCACPFEHVDAKAASWLLPVERADEAGVLGDRRTQVLQPELSVSFLVCNTEAGPLSDPQFRRALALAIDAERVTESVFGGAWMPAEGIVPPGVHGRAADSEAWAFSSYDAEASSELLDRLYPLGEDGTRGIELTLLYSADGGQKRAMEAISADLEAVGIACALDAVGFDEAVERYRAGDFQLGRFDWTADAPCLDAVLYPLFHSSRVGSHNLSRYANATVDGLLDKARSTVDEAERLALLRQVDELVGRDCPVIPYAYPARAHVASERVAQLPVTPEGILQLAVAELAE